MTFYEFIKIKKRRNRMRKLLIFAIVCSFIFAGVALADKTKMTGKVGDEIYVCGCGDGCDCDYMSKNPGKCACGKDLVKTKISKVEEGKITVEARKTPFVSAGKYACACGSECKCDTIGQKPGKCACDKDMAPVAKK
jgi:hypothetical protein